MGHRRARGGKDERHDGKGAAGGALRPGLDHGARPGRRAAARRPEAKRRGAKARAKRGTVRLRQVAAHRGWTVVEEFVDEGISGAKASRPALDRMMEAARLGKIDVVAVWKLDRLGRSQANLLSTLDELGHHGVGFVSLRDAGIDTTSPAGRLLLQLMGAFAEFERGLIRERVKAGVDRARAKGVKFGRSRVEVDLRPAVAMLEAGHGIKQTASALRLSTSTLRRRLQAAGEWPRPGGS
ncbi:MAG: recombinase family protein [Deltaproteobacteria bacterium]|nr:recombinase family protein [Deltaproteobacteria bacterium]